MDVSYLVIASIMLSQFKQDARHSTVTKIRSMPEARDPGKEKEQWKGPLLSIYRAAWSQSPYSPPKAYLILLLIGIDCQLPELVWLHPGAHF